MKRKTFKMLASWWFTAVILLSLIVLYIATENSSQPACSEFYRGLFFSPSGILLYCLLILNLFFVSVRIAVNSLSQKPPDRKSMDALVVLESERWSNVRATLREFSLPAEIPENMFYKKLRRWSFLPGTMLRVSIIIVLISLLISVHTEKRTSFVTHRGDNIKQLSGLQVLDIKAPLQEDFLQIGEDGGFSLAEAEVVLQDGNSTYHISSLMPERVGKYYMRITHLGYYRKITISDQKGSIMIDRELDLLPPGKTAIIPVSERNYFLTITLSPERTIRKGILTGSQFNLRKPSFMVVLQQGRGKKQIAKAVVKDAQKIRLADVTIGIRDRGLFARILCVKNPVYEFLKGGLISLVFSLLFMLLRFFWFKKELLIERQGDNVAVYYKEEFYRKWAVTRFQRDFEGLSIV